ncbi:DNA double-strand break repair Rad50 ATPase [uncultured archaeon]|nr:DNA double-strand break repair Rad50 ATPase [uncultured archaeon]
MIIKKLKLNNIRSYRELEIEFPVGSTLLSGDIGAGKTSILLALQFALFGLQPGQKGNSILRHGEESAEVSLELEIGGKQIVIQRRLKKAKSGGITQDYNTISIDGKLEEVSTSEMKNTVISLLEYPKEFAKKSDLLYKYTVYTPQEGMKEIIQERPEVRLDLIRHIFGIDRYKRIKANTQILLQKIKEDVKIKEMQIREINLLREKLGKSNEDKIKISKEVIELNINLDRLNEQKKQISERLDKSKKLLDEKVLIDITKSKKEGELNGKKSLKVRLEKDILASKHQILEKVDFKNEELINVNSLIITHKKTLEDLNNLFMEVNSKIYSYDAQKENAFKMKEKVTSMENCPMCLQGVSHEHKDKISKKTQFEIEDIQRELDRKFVEKEQILGHIKKEKDLISGYEQDKLSLERNKVKFEHQRVIEVKIKSDAMILERTEEEIKNLESEIKTLSKELDRFVESKISFEAEKKLFDNIDFESRRTEINVAEKRKEYELLIRKVEELGMEIAEKEKIRGQISSLRSLQDWLEVKFLSLINLTETSVLATLRRDFSRVFNEWFSLLVSESLTARLDEDFTPIITNQDYELDYEFLSGGERTAVALAYRLALNQIINSMMSTLKTKDIIILDEPTDGFSEQQLDKMRDIFDQLDSQQILLVSHEQKIEGFVDNIIRLKKEGISRIENIRQS